MSFRKPVNTNLTQAFGADFQLNGKWYYKSMGYGGHNGADYAAPIGTPVYAADDGTVVFEGWGQNHSWMGSPAGICVLIHHGGCYGGYAHLNSTTVNKGQWVSKGQLIGYVGQTGAATGPHLHFEALPLQPVFSNGYAGRIDPTPYMDAPAKPSSEDQVRQAYRDILEREADADGLRHYVNYAIDFVRSDLASSQDYRDLQARKAAAARAAAEQAAREAEAKRLAEEQARAEQIRREAEAKARAEADARAAEEARLRAEQEAKAAAEKAAQEAAEKAKDPTPLDDPFNVPGRGSIGLPPTHDNPPLPTTPEAPKTPQPNPLIRFIFGLILKLVNVKKKA